MIYKKFIKLNAFLVIFLVLSITGYAASSYRIASGQSQIICEFSVCRKVINNAGYDVFIPTNTASEWAAVESNQPPNVKVCDPYTMVSCGAWSSCSTTCGTGTQTRTCTNKCGETVVQSQSCTDTSSVGVVSSCTGWGSCSTTCGWGSQYRTCYYVCGGSTTQSQSCYDCGSCGQISSCTGWSDCTGGGGCYGGNSYRTCYYTCGGSTTQSQSCGAHLKSNKACRGNIWYEEWAGHSYESCAYNCQRTGAVCCEWGGNLCYPHWGSNPYLIDVGGWYADLC